MRWCRFLCTLRGNRRPRNQRETRLLLWKELERARRDVNEEQDRSARRESFALVAAIVAVFIGGAFLLAADHEPFRSQSLGLQALSFLLASLAAALPTFAIIGVLGWLVLVVRRRY